MTTLRLKRHFLLGGRVPGSLSPTSGTTATATPETERQELPYGDQDDRTDQRSDNEDPKDVDITDPADDDDFGEQPGPNERRDDGSDEAEGQPPAHQGLGNQADDRRHNQVENEVETERPDIVTQFDGDAICRIEGKASILSSF
jgi:hypothetical protein